MKIDPGRADRRWAAGLGASLAGMLVAALLCPIPPLQAQDGGSDVPAIPRLEQFTPSDALSVSLHVEPDRVQVDEVPGFTVSLTNVGAEPVLVRPVIVADLRIYTPSGEFVPGRSHFSTRDFPQIATLEDAIVLEPGETVMRAVAAVYRGRWPSENRGWGGHTEYKSREGDDGLGLPPGEYIAQVTYMNYPDYTNRVYDVRGARASGMWEGRIESPPARLMVEAPAGDRLAALIAQIDGPEPAVTAIRIAGAARLTEATDSLLRRYTRTFDSDMARFEIVRAIAAIGDPDAAAQFLDVLVSHAHPGWPSFLALDLTVPPRLMALAPDCARLRWLFELGQRSTDGVLAIDARCPGLRATLREILQTPSPLDSLDTFTVSDRRRTTAATLLGALRDTESVPLLSAVLRQPAARDSLAGAVDRVRASAADALGLIDGPLAHIALIEALDNPANDGVLPSLMGSVERAAPPGAGAAVARLLSSAPPATMPHVIRTAGLVGGAAVVPPLQALARDPDVEVAREAVRALGQAGGAAVRALMADVAAQGPAHLRAPALEYLAEHGDTSTVSLLVDAATAGEYGDWLFNGLERFGTAGHARRLRLALETASEGPASYIHHALHHMTFAPYELGFHNRIADWIEWFDRRRERTRVQWAEDAVARVTAAPAAEGSSTAAVHAIAYLAAQSAPDVAMLRSAAMLSPSWMVRVSASRALVPFDRPLAVRLLARELQNRHLYACATAARELEVLTQHPPIDCTSPAGRAAAAAALSR